MLKWIAIRINDKGDGQPVLLNMSQIHSIQASDEGVIINMGNEIIPSDIHYSDFLDFVCSQADIFIAEYGKLK